MSLIGSDQYTKDIALNAENSYSVNKEAAGYTKEDIENFKEITQESNRREQADQAAFYLFKP
jgi:hypothetical protein